MNLLLLFSSPVDSRNAHTTNKQHGRIRAGLALESQTRPAVLCLFRHSPPDHLLYVFLQLPCLNCHICRKYSDPTVIDAAPLLPSFLQIDLSRQLREFYVNTYNDKFFEHPAPVWFVVFITMEIWYHAPLSIWAIGALLRGSHPPTSWIRGNASVDAMLMRADDPMVPVHLLVFGVQSFVTSLPCLAEVWGWTDRTLVEKQNLTMLYSPYVALGTFAYPLVQLKQANVSAGAFMALDMIFRLRARLVQKNKSE